MATAARHPPLTRKPLNSLVADTVRPPPESILLQRVFEKFDSDTWIEAGGIVVRLFQDDQDRAPHQRFVVDLRNGQTVLVTHNIDVAQRVPLAIGDRVAFRGLYEWNDLGGLVHWTHRDPMGIEAGGYVRYRKTEYR